MKEKELNVKTWLIWTGVLLALFEGVAFAHWLLFSTQARPFDWKEPIVVVLCMRVGGTILTAVLETCERVKNIDALLSGKQDKSDEAGEKESEGTGSLDERLGRIEALLGGTAKRDDDEDAEGSDAGFSSLSTRLRNVETMLESHYKFGDVYAVNDDEEQTDLARVVEDLDDAERTELSELIGRTKSGKHADRLESLESLGSLYDDLARKHADKRPETKEHTRKAAYWWRKAAKAGYDCESELADAYTELEEYDKAMLWHRKSLKRGGWRVPYTESTIGTMYAEGKGVLQNHVEAARWWKQAAQHGSEYAHALLGSLYMDGAEGVPQDYRASYFHQFTHMGSSKGRPTPPSEHSIKQLAKAAEHLSAREIDEAQQLANEWIAQHDALLSGKQDKSDEAGEKESEGTGSLDERLGRIEALLGGTAKRDDDEDAEGSDAGFSSLSTRLRNVETMLESHYKFGDVYAVNDDEEQTDLARVVEDLDDAERTELSELIGRTKSGKHADRLESLESLGSLYDDLARKHADKRPETKDHTRKAAYWWRKAAKAGYDCESELADAYTELEEYDKAMLWHRKSLKRGGWRVPYTESTIGTMYAEGKGVLQNHVEAARWWKQAAQHGSEYAHALLGSLYMDGAEGVPQDYRASYFHQFTHMGSSKGRPTPPSEHSIKQLAKAAEHLSAREIDEAQQLANEWIARHVKPKPAVGQTVEQPAQA